MLSRQSPAKFVVSSIPIEPRSRHEVSSVSIKKGPDVLGLNLHYASENPLGPRIGYGPGTFGNAVGGLSRHLVAFLRLGSGGICVKSITDGVVKARYVWPPHCVAVVDS